MAERGFLGNAMRFAHGVLDGVEALTPGPRTSAARTAWQIKPCRDELGAEMFLVTDGVDEALCSSRELAERVRRALG